MRRANILCRSLVLAAGILILPVAGAVAPSVREPMVGYGHRIDWVAHTQATLAELKGKLNLAPSQAAAWDAWSAGVMKDASEQLAARKPWLEESAPREQKPWEGSTPERMRRGIDRLRAENEWMQRHLVQLEGALERTQTFYAALDANQKTIFDMFWHEMFHRVAGLPPGPELPEGCEERHSEHCGARW